MHQNSTYIMRNFVSCLNENLNYNILDVGSYNVNGSYKPMFEKPNWKYSGLDIVEGPNVDIIVDKYGKWENINSETYDVIVSGQCLEHVEAPWLLAEAIGRVAKPGGVVFVIVPWAQGMHKYPLDCWRILPDGLEYIFTKMALFEKWVCGFKDGDAFFCGRKGGNDTIIADKNKLVSFWRDLSTKEREVRIF